MWFCASIIGGKKTNVQVFLQRQFKKEFTMSKINKKDPSLIDIIEHNKAQTKALKKLLKSIEAQKEKNNHGAKSN
jgi:hypothetical protein